MLQFLQSSQSVYALKKRGDVIIEAIAPNRHTVDSDYLLRVCPSSQSVYVLKKRGDIIIQAILIWHLFIESPLGQLSFQTDTL